MNGVVALQGEAWGITQAFQHALAAHVRPKYYVLPSLTHTKQSPLNINK